MTINGTNLTGTTQVAINGVTASFTVVADSQITTKVPSGAATGKISVTTPHGQVSSTSNFFVTNSPPVLDLSIESVQITQATQDYPAATVPLVQDRSSWLRVFVKADQPNNEAPQVAVQFINGGDTQNLIIDAKSAQVPMTTNPGLPFSWDAAVPSSWIQPGVQVVATVDPASLITEFDKSNNQMSYEPEVRKAPPLKVTLVPVHTGDGRVGTIEDQGRSRNDWIDFAKRIYPVPDAIDVTVGSVMNSSVNVLDDSSDKWSKVLSELDAKRNAEGVTDRNYFGVVNIAPGYHSGGKSIINGSVAVGYDGATFPIVLAHEMGHNFGRQHSPCGNPAGPDPNYPYPTGNIGVAGWNVFADNNQLVPSYFTDIMTYCQETVWISDYTYKGVLQYRANNTPASAFDTTARSEKGLLVWGHINANEEVTLEPAFLVPAETSVTGTGPYLWDARDETGHRVASASFTPKEVADLGDTPSWIFSFVVPVTSEVVNSIQSLHIFQNGRELARTVPVFAAFDSEAKIQTQRLSRGMRIAWDSQQLPMVMLKNGQTGEVLGFAREGDAVLENVPLSVEIHVSDGVRSHMLGPFVRQR